MVTQTPDRGDLVWLDFDPQSGHEQSGSRPALVLSPKDYNRVTGLMLVCPITGQVKGYPFEVLLPAGLKTKGAVLSDHIKSVDWQSRKARFIETCSEETVDEIMSKLAVLLKR